MAYEDPREEKPDPEDDQQGATDSEKEVEDDKDDKKTYRYSDWASI